MHRDLDKIEPGAPCRSFQLRKDAAHV